MSPRTIIFLAALLAGTGVGLGAYGAHGLEKRLVASGFEEDLPKRLAWFETGVRYQLTHALGLFLVAILSLQIPQASFAKLAPWTFLAGCLLFSGSLYVMTLVSPAWKKLGAVVPLGGLSFIIGWAAIAIAAWKMSGSAES